MAIGPIEMNGIISRTQDYSTIKQNEDNKGLVQQQAFQTHFEKELDASETPSRIEDEAESILSEKFGFDPADEDFESADEDCVVNVDFVDPPRSDEKPLVLFLPCSNPSPPCRSLTVAPQLASWFHCMPSLCIASFETSMKRASM